MPFADVGPLKLENGFSDEQLFLTDVFPIGFMGAEMCDIRGGEVIAVRGAAPGPWASSPPRARSCWARSA